MPAHDTICPIPAIPSLSYTSRMRQQYTLPVLSHMPLCLQVTVAQPSSHMGITHSSSLMPRSATSQLWNPTINFHPYVTGFLFWIWYCFKTFSVLKFWIPLATATPHTPPLSLPSLPYPLSYFYLLTVTELMVPPQITTCLTLNKNKTRQILKMKLKEKNI